MAIKMVSQLIILGHLFISAKAADSDSFMSGFFIIAEEEWFPHGTILYEDEDDPRGFITGLAGDKQQDGTGETKLCPKFFPADVYFNSGVMYTCVKRT